MKTTKSILAAIVSLAFICGCNLENGNNGTTTTTNEIARAVCIGVENGFAGDCPGALVDAKRMKDLLKSNKLVDDVVLLLDKDASRSRVMKEMEKACKADLAIIFYSGHGGQNKYGDPSEEDGKDEFMCLYDRELLDNDIWNILSKGKRVVLICDCCHSKTMFRTSNISKKMLMMSSKRDAKARSAVSMLCWSGCPDNTYSYGSSDGGEFTNTLLAYFSKFDTYAQLWDKIKSDKSLKKAELVQETVIGEDFRSMKVFR